MCLLSSSYTINCLLLPSDDLKHAVIDIIHSGGLINWLLSSSLFDIVFGFCKKKYRLSVDSLRVRLE
ncbi:CLUMA_CG013585, isoform A [Clunio marinus]|uniref:CLUMA_CG013585, isoform A n=1 Tax=Clunio marinus TaxID=568069 RepID=A0A1J1IJD7_9DIPT|nr:CLUMA_CG013585, isoform A [Clunio marinus]